MAKEEKLRYIIEALWKGGQAVVQATTGFTSVGKAAKGLQDDLKSMGSAWSDLATPVNQTLEIFGKVQQTVGRAWAALKEGAAIEKTAGQFDRLAESIGTTSDALETRLKSATGGMLTSAEVMASGVEIVSLGLANTEENVARLAGLVAKLGWDMQTVIMTFANDSKMRLDALGLSVTDVEERMKKFTDAGMAVGEAFDLAVIEAGEAKLKLLGDTSLTTAGQLDILETSLKELREQALLAMAQGVGPFIAALTGANLMGIADMAQQTLDLADSLDAVGAAARGAQYVFDVAMAQPFGNPARGVELIEDAVDRMVALAPTRREAFDEMMSSFTGPALEIAQEHWLELNETMEAGLAGGRLHVAGINQELERMAVNVERVSAAGRASGQEGGLLGGLFPADGWRARAWLDSVNEPMRQLLAMRDQMAREATTERRQEFNAGIAFDTTAMDDASATLLEVATNAGASAEQLYNLAGGGQAAEDALVSAAVNAKAADLGEAVAAGTLLARDALQQLQDFADGLTLADVFAMDEPIAGAKTVAESAKAEMLRVVEGIDESVTTATAPAQEAVDTFKTELETLSETTATPTVDTSSIATADSAAKELRRYWTEELEGTRATMYVDIVTTGAFPEGAPPPPGRASGGPVSPGKVYTVGERGPELFVPNSSGQIVAGSDLRPGAMGGMSGPVIVNQNFNGLGIAGSLAVARGVLARYTMGAR
jgi:hypothetical protein